MITNIITFDTPADLIELTGSPRETLIDAGFDFSDMDGGFCVTLNEESKNWFVNELQYTIGDKEFRKMIPLWDKCPDFIHYIIDQMDLYCVGYNSVIYRDRVFFMKFHG